MGTTTLTAVRPATTIALDTLTAGESTALQAAALFSRGFDLELARIAADQATVEHLASLIGTAIFAQSGPFHYRIDAAILPALEWDEVACHGMAERAISELHARLTVGLSDREATATVGLIHQLCSDFSVDVDWKNQLMGFVPLARPLHSGHPRVSDYVYIPPTNPVPSPRRS